MLGEVLALRTSLIMNLLFSLGSGKPVTPEAMQELIARADGDKARRAMERLTAVTGASRRPGGVVRRNGSWRGGPGNGGVGTEGILEGVAEPDARVDVDGVVPVGGCSSPQCWHWDYSQSWTAAERLYLSDYLKSGARGQASARSQSARYTFAGGLEQRRVSRSFIMGDEIEPVPGVERQAGYRLTDEGVKAGIARLQWVTGVL